MIIKALVTLFEKRGKDAAYITSAEIYSFLQPLKDEECIDAVSKILEARDNEERQTYSSDKVRKINEMLAFLSIAGYVYIDSTQSGEDKYWLNLIMRHPREKTLFYLQRTAGGAGTGTSKEKVNIIVIYKNLWEE